LLAIVASVDTGWLDGAAYVVANAPIVREQLQKTGVRLAHLLDAALGK
jgi:hypothetical protein